MYVSKYSLKRVSPVDEVHSERPLQETDHGLRIHLLATLQGLEEGRKEGFACS